MISWKRLQGLDLHLWKNKTVGTRQERARWYSKGLWLVTQRAVNVCVPREHYNRRWVKSQQGRGRNSFVRHLGRLQRESLSIAAFKNSLDKCNCGQYENIVILSQDRRLVWVSSGKWGGCQAVVINTVISTVITKPCALASHQWKVSQCEQSNMPGKCSKIKNLVGNHLQCYSSTECACSAYHQH